MNFIYYLIRKDILKLWPLLLTWAAILAAHFFAETALHRAFFAGDQQESALETTNRTLIILKFAVLTLMIYLLVHEEAPLGSTGFWLTRPISPRVILCAKMLFILGLLLVPSVVAEGLYWQAIGIANPDLQKGLLEFFLRETQIAMVVFMIAALTPNFGIFMMASIGFAAVMTALELGINYSVKNLSWINPFFRSFSDDIKTSTVCWARFFSVTLGSIVVVLHQYTTKRRRRSIALLVMAVVVAQTVRNFYPFRFPNFPERSDVIQGLSIDHVEAAINSGITLDDTRGDHKFKDIMARIVASNTPPHYEIQPYYLRAKFVLPSGEVITNHAHPASEYVTPVASSVPMTNTQTALQHAVLPLTIVNPWQMGRPKFILLRLKSDEYEKYLNTTGTYSAEIRFKVYRYEVVHDLELKPGATDSCDSEKTAVMNVDLSMSANIKLDIDLKRQKMYSSLQNDLWALFSAAQRLSPRTYYLLYNYARGTVLMENAPPMAHCDVCEKNKGLIHREHFTVSYDLALQPPNMTPEQINQQIATSSLLVVKRIEVGEFNKTLTIKDFCLSHFTPTTDSKKIFIK